MNDKSFCVYCFIDQNQKPFYVGITCNLKRRTRKHLSEVKKGNTLPKYNKLRKVFREHNLSIDDCIKIIEDNITSDDIFDKEIYYISKLREEGYNLKNLTDGGEGGIHTTPEIIEKVRQAHLGKKRSEETKRKISEARMGMKFSKEHKKNLSIARKKRITTDETRIKMSEASKGKINTKQYKLIDPDGNEHITHEGLTKFCEEHGLLSSLLHKVINGERKHHKGWIAERIDDETK